MARFSVQERSDPAVAREVIDSIFAGAPSGAKVEYQKFLRSSVRYLSRSYSDRWEITLFNRCLRLNVGWVECLILSSNGLRLLLVEGDSVPSRTEFDQVYRRWAPGCDYTTLSLSEIPRRLDSFTKSHQAALSIAADRRPPENIRNAHSTGVTRLLGLPDPITRRYWTSYWKGENWAGNDEYKPVSCSGSNLFRKRGVSVGDVVYVVSQIDGQLRLGGRMKVGDIVSRDEAVRLRRSSNLYDLDEWVIGERG
jgi:hypothetical protein